MFSEREAKIIKVIGDKTLTFEVIANKIFKDEKPFDANITISNSIRRIMKKCEHHKLDWTFTKETVMRTAVIKKVKR